MSLTIYIDNHNVIELSGLKNSATNVIDTGATVEVTLKDENGNNVAGQTWPATMAHDSGGLYRATLDEDLDLTPLASYVAHVDATGSGGQVGHWEKAVTARTRT